MTNPDYRALITEMAAELDHCQQLLLDDRRQRHPLADRARWGRPAAAPLVRGEMGDLSQISDGYHTFAELYEHRHALMLALMRATPQMCWFSQRHHDGELPFGSEEWFIVGAELPSGAITYHLPIGLLCLAQQTGAAELPVGRPWDGHTANDVVDRLRAWAALAESEAEGPTDEELYELWEREGYEGDFQDCRRFYRAAVARWGRPAAAPVPVSERLPGPEDCDAEGRCWLGGHLLANGTPTWLLGYPAWVARFQDVHHFWLPANALPLPAPEGGEVRNDH